MGNAAIQIAPVKNAEMMVVAGCVVLVQLTVFINVKMLNVFVPILVLENSAVWIVAVILAERAQLVPIVMEINV
jgi:hypothetical protein